MNGGTMGRRSERLSKQGMLASDLAGEGDVIQVVSRAFDVLRCFEGHEARLGNLEISRLPSRASCPSKHRSTSNARDTTWITSPSPERSLASIPCLLSRSERLPMRWLPFRRTE